MAEKELNFNEEERKVLRQSRLLQDLVQTEGWKAYVEILESHIATREALVLSPLLDQKGVDFTAKAVAVEMVKGALIALKLARDLPSTTITLGSTIRSDHEGESER